MKNLRLSFAYLAMLGMIFTSCSKEETGADANQETTTLSFGAIVNDLMNSRAAEKQSVGDIPECSDDVPAYVSVVLSRDGSDVVGSDDDPFEIQLVDGQIFTEEVAELQLDPDTYSLEHFAVYNDDDEVIWIAPRTGSNLGGWINNPLPLSINLQAGVKKYVEVPVLCFDNRNLNEYGYLFFELLPTEAVEFCFFANYCPPNSGGRHFTASYSVSIWSGTTAAGDPIYTSVENTTGQYDNGDYYAEPLCFALPTNDDMDEEYLYYEVTLLDWTGNYGTVTPNTVISGTLSMNDIIENFDGDDSVDYEHLRFSCGDDGGNGGNPPVVDTDQDGIPDANDDCPTVPGPASNEGCPVDTACVYEDECDIEDVNSSCFIGGINTNLDFHEVNETNNYTLNHGVQVPSTAAPLGVIESSYDSNDNLVIKLTAYEGFSLSGYVLEVRPVDPTTGAMSETCREISCTNDAPGDSILETFVNVLEGEEYYIRLEAVVCPDDADQDGVPDATDVCPQDPGPATNSGCPIDTECAFEEGCDIADAVSPCVSFKTWGTNNLTGSNTDFDFFSAGFGQGGSALTDPETGQTLGMYIAQINESGFLEVYFRDYLEGLALSAYVIEVRPLDPETGKASKTCREITCNSDVVLTENPPYYSTSEVEVFSSIKENESFFLRIEAIGCP